MASAALYKQADDAFVSMVYRYPFRLVERDVGFFWPITAEVEQKTKQQ